MVRQRLTVITCAIAALILAISFPARGEETDANRDRARELWEEAIRAKGGRERLHSIQNFLISSTIHVEAKRGSNITETQLLYGLPDKAWLYRYTPRFDVSTEATVINLKRNLCTVTLSPPNGDVPLLSLCLPSTFPEHLIQDPIIYLMETRWVRPVPIRTREARTGLRQVDVVETEVGKMRVDFYLDRKTRLPIKLVTDHYFAIPEMAHPMGLTVFLDDYVTVDGIKMPRSVVREPNYFQDRDRRDLEFARYQFNVAHEQTIFDHAAPRNVKAADWKPPKTD